MVRLIINGRERTLDVDPRMPLLWVLRDVTRLTGTKYGCGAGLCGACLVHADGQPLISCLTPVGSVEGQSITTIEGLDDRVGEAVRAAWNDLDVVQCGYCQSGQIMAAAALLARNPDPTDDDIDAALGGNLCRCATYVRIRAAVRRAARDLA